MGAARCVWVAEGGCCRPVNDEVGTCLWPRGGVAILSLLDCGTAVLEEWPWRPHYCGCYTRCILCCIGKRPSGATPQPARAPTAPVRQTAAPVVSRGPTHHCGQQPSPPRPGGAYVAQCHGREARTHTLARLLRPPPEVHPRLPVHSSSDASGERPATAAPATAAQEECPQRSQHMHRLGTSALTRRGDACQCPPHPASPPPSHLAIQTIKDNPLPGLISGAHRRRRPRPHTVSSGARQRSPQGAYCTARVGVQGRQERVNEACGRVPSACTVHAGSKEKGAVRRGVGRKGREMATHQFDAAGRALCPPKQCAQSQPGARGWRLHEHTQTHTHSRGHGTPPAAAAPATNETVVARTSGAASPVQTTPGGCSRGDQTRQAGRARLAVGGGRTARTPTCLFSGAEGCVGAAPARGKTVAPLRWCRTHNSTHHCSPRSSAARRTTAAQKLCQRTVACVGWTTPSSAMQHVNDRCDERPPSVRGEGACWSLAAAQAGPGGPTAGWAPCVQGRAGNLSGKGGDGGAPAGDGCVGCGGLVPEFLKILPSGPLRSRPTFRHPLASPPVSNAVLRGGRRCVVLCGGKRPPRLGRIRDLLRCDASRASRPRGNQGG